MLKEKRTTRLNYQLITIIFIILIIPLSLLAYYFYSSTVSSMKKIGMEQSITSVQIGQSLLDNMGKNLLSITRSNSHWEDFREAIDKKNTSWIQLNVNENLSSVSALDFIVTTDSQGNILSSAEKENHVVQNLDYSKILSRLTKDDDFFGLINTTKGLAFIAVSKVTSDNGQAAPTGTLIFGSFLNEETFKYMEDTLQVNLGIINNEKQLFSSTKSITLKKMKSYLDKAKGANVSVETIMDHDTLKVRANKLIIDIANQPVGLIHIEYPLQTSTKVIKSLKQTVISSSFIVIILLFILHYVLQSRILSPLNHFKMALEQVLTGKSIKDIPNNIIAHAEKNILLLFEQLHKLAYYDYLTDLPNRRFSTIYTEKVIKEATFNNQKVAVMYLDLDRFKNINDSLGHNTGDQLLKIVAKRLEETVSNKGFVGRLGGDEFTIILPGIEDANEPKRLAEKVIRVFTEPFIVDDYDLFITSSIGVSIYPEDGKIGDDLFMNADVAMFRAKEQGRNKFQFYSSVMNSTLIDKLKIESDLRGALNQNQLFLTYQPKISIETNEIVGMEALIRWMHPELGIVAPNDFIPIAEETGLIISIGEWVLKTACAQNKLWQDQGMPNLKIAVNISARQFQHDDITKLVSRVLKETGLEPKWLELEITESTAMSYANETIKTLNELKQIGISISIDDFGTGYSSLSYLKLFPINSLKIDRSFIKDIEKGTGDLAIVKSVITLGHALNFEVVAEGVENLQQLEILQQENCDVSQGYYYSPPITAEVFEGMLKGVKRV